MTAVHIENDNTQTRRSVSEQVLVLIFIQYLIRCIFELTHTDHDCSCIIFFWKCRKPVNIELELTIAQYEMIR